MLPIDFRAQLVVCFFGIVWGLHLMTRSQDYKRIRQRFERARNKFEAEKYGGREKVLRFLGFVMTGVTIWYFYEVLTTFTDFEI